MSKINFISLGGCQENGKNLYVVEVDSHIFVLDCGIKYPVSELYGVDYIRADMTYLISRKKDIVALFLTHAHDDAMGAVDQFVRLFPDKKIVGSKFTIALAKDLLLSKGIDVDDKKFKVIDSKSKIKLGETGIAVSFFNTAHNVPDSYGVIIHTHDGNIVYTSNFTFDPNQHQADYLAMFSALTSASKEGVLALMCESLGALSEGARGSIYEFKQRIEGIFVGQKGRLIFSMFSSDIQRMQQIINIAGSFNRNIAILGRDTQRIVNQAIKMGYLTFPQDRLVKLNYISDKNTNNDPNLVVIVAGERHQPYHSLTRMAECKDRFININKNDNIIILTNPYPGTEKLAARTLDTIYKVCTNVITFDKNLIPESHADREEIKLLINILHPKYIFPIIGEYRHQYALIQIANCVGFNYKDNLIICENGDIHSFTDGAYLGIKGEAPVGEIMSDGDEIEDLGQAVVKDREILGENGVILLTANVNPRTKEVISPVQIITKGFSYISEHPEFEDSIREAFNQVSEKHLSQDRVDWKEYKGDVTREISRLIYKTKSDRGQSSDGPIIIPILISTDPYNLNKPRINLDESNLNIKKKKEFGKKSASGIKFTKTSDGKEVVIPNLQKSRHKEDKKPVSKEVVKTKPGFAKKTFKKRIVKAKTTAD